MNRSYFAAGVGSLLAIGFTILGVSGTAAKEAVASAPEAWMEEEEASPAVVDPLTGLAADGSDYAKTCRVGFVHIVRSTGMMVIDLQRATTEGQLEDTTTELVSSGTTSVVGGDVSHGLPVQVGDAIGQGVLKNPGPDVLQAQIVDLQSGEIHALVLQPGHGIMVQAEGIAEVLAPTHTPGCICMCTRAIDTDIPITVKCCPASMDPEQSIECDCACRSSKPCWVEIEGELQRGNTAGCLSGMIPS